MKSGKRMSLGRPLLWLATLGPVLFALMLAGQLKRHEIVALIEEMFDGNAAASLLAAALSAAGACALGVVLGRFLAGDRRGGGVMQFLLKVAILVPLALHPVFLGGVIASLCNAGPAPATGTAGTSLRWLLMTLSGSLSLAPMAGMVAFLVLRAIPTAEWNSACCMLTRFQAWRRVIWPRLRQPMLLCLVALTTWSAHDMISPTHFGLETLATRIGLEFQRSLDSALAAAAMLPLWLGLAGVVLIMARPLVRNGGRRPRMQALPASRPATLAAAGYAAVAVVLPGVVLGGRVEGFQLQQWLSKYQAEILNTVQLGLLVASMGAAVHVAGVICRIRRDSILATGSPIGNALQLLALSLALCTPGLALGLMVSSTAGAWPGVQDSPLSIAALMLRALPAAVILVMLTPVASAERAVAAVHVSDRRRVRHVLSGPAGRGILVTALVASALLFREVEIQAAFPVPETETLGVRALQGLHYGLSNEAALPALLQGLVAVIWSLLLVRTLQRREPRHG